MRARLSAVAFFLVATGAQAQVRETDFFGTWMPIEDPNRSCVVSGEGGHFTLQRNYYEPGDGAACKEAKTWLHGQKLRVSATCEGEEYGFRATTREFTLIRPNELSTPSLRENKIERYVLCTMPRHQLRSSHVQSVLNANAELDAAATKEVANAEALEKINRKIIQKFGFSSAAQYDEIKFIMTDILQSMDEPDYLARRHSKENVDLVRANKAALSKLTETPAENAQ